MQPFSTIQNYGYQPQFGGYQQYNPVSPYQDRLAQLQAQYNQVQPYNSMVQPSAQAQGLNGEIVDGIEVVRAKNVDLSGAVTYYPKADLSEIYTKQLQADGTSKIVTYKAIMPEANHQTTTQTVTIEMLNAMLGQLKQDLSQEIGSIKEMVGALTIKPEPIESSKAQQRGGGQK